MKRFIKWLLFGILEALICSIFGFLLFVGIAYINTIH